MVSKPSTTMESDHASFAKKITRDCWRSLFPHKDINRRTRTSATGTPRVRLTISSSMANREVLGRIARPSGESISFQSSRQAFRGKGKGMFLCSAVSSPLNRSKRFTLFLPWQTCSFQHQRGFSWKHSSHAAITRNDYSLTFPPPSIAWYTFTQLSEVECHGENDNAHILKR